MQNQTKNQSEFIEKVIEIGRICRTVKGGRRIRFRALVVIGDMKGRVGIGIAKAQEVVGAISKALSEAKKNIITINIVNETIPHDIKYKFGSAVVYLKPAPKGTSIVAGGSLRAVLELAGIKNVVGKILGSNNKINNVYATYYALQSFISRKPNSKKTTVKIDETKTETAKKSNIKNNQTI